MKPLTTQDRNQLANKYGLTSALTQLKTGADRLAFLDGFTNAQVKATYHITRIKALNPVTGQDEDVNSNIPVVAVLNNGPNAGTAYKVAPPVITMDALNLSEEATWLRAVDAILITIHTVETSAL